jgi:hypothetical protein
VSSRSTPTASRSIRSCTKPWPWSRIRIRSRTRSSR